MSQTEPKHENSENASVDEETSNVSVAPKSSTFDWMAHQISAAQSRSEIKNWLLLDSQSSVDLFCNPSLVDNIREEPEKLLLATNAGVLQTNKQTS